jgi:hypothetical protein
MFRARQFHLLLGAAKDYQGGRVSLERLIYVLEGITAVLDDDAVYDLFRDESSLLEQIYAQARIGEGKYDFESEGRAEVDRCVASIIAKSEARVQKLEQEGENPDDHPKN